MPRAPNRAAGRRFAITCATRPTKREPMSLIHQARRLERQVRDRRRELEPLVREYEQLRKLAERLGLKDAAPAPRAGGEARPADTTARANAKAPAPKRAARGAAKPTARSASRPRSAGANG